VSKTKKPQEFVPIYSANFIIGRTFLHYALQGVSIAFMAGGK
jgi:hypothetical protein